MPTLIDWNQLDTLCTEKIQPRITDQISRSNLLQMKLYRKGTKLDGGKFIVEPLETAENGGGPYSVETVLNATPVNKVKAAIFGWKFYFVPGWVSHHDELMQGGKHGIVKMVRVEMQSMGKTMRNQLGQGLYSDGLTNPLAITGAEAMVAASGVYGGISKATNAFWQSPVDSTTTTLSESAMRTLRGRVTDGDDTTDLIMTDQTIYNIFYSLLTPQRRYASGDIARAGFMNVLFEGVPVGVDYHCLANHMYFFNTKYVDFVTHSAENMRLEGWKQPVLQPQLRVNFMFWAGNLTGNNCRRQAKFTNIQK